MTPEQKASIRNHILIGLDAIVPPNSNEQKTVNHDVKALDTVGQGGILPGTPFVSVSVPPDRVWNASQGPMPVRLVMQNSDGTVNRDFNGALLLVGPGLQDRPQLTAGAGSADVTLDANGVVTIYAFDPVSKATGNSPTFSWLA